MENQALKERRYLLIATKQTDFPAEACLFRNHLSKTNFSLYC